MYISKQMLAWLFVAGAGMVGWLLWWSSDDHGEPVAAAAAERPAALEPPTLRLTIVRPDGETSTDVKVQADPVPDVAPARVSGERSGNRADGAAASTVHQDLTVLASRGAIVYLGDDGALTANTGDVKSSGAVTIDSVDSTLSTGQSTVTGVVRAANGEVVNEFTPHLADRAVAIAGYENHSVRRSTPGIPVRWTVPMRR